MSALPKACSSSHDHGWTRTDSTDDASITEGHSPEYMINCQFPIELIPSRGLKTTKKLNRFEGVKSGNLFSTWNDIFVVEERER